MTDLAKIAQTEITPAQITPMDLLQKATESGADLDKLEKLMDLQERWEKRESHKAYISAKTTFLAGCPPIEKTKKGHNSKYSPLADTIKIVRPLLTDCGFSYDWKIKQNEGKIEVTCVLSHIDGHSEECPLEADADSTGSKNAVQALGSTVQYLKRYSFEAILGISSQDEDDDGKGAVQYITPDQVAKLQEINSERGNNSQDLCTYLQVSSLSALPKSRFNEAMQAVKSKVKK